MSPASRHQRGVVTLMGAMFVLVTITLLLVVLQRITGSQSLASALQNDSVEALFLAESAIERASYHYASGTACADLATVADTTTDGSFSVQSAQVLANGDCRVVVEGRASSTTAANAAVRTASADLRAGSAGEAWAIGRNGELFLWDGSTWTQLATSPTNEKLKAVTCPTTTECWAVGKNGTILHYAGGTWTATVLNSDEDYEDIDCAPNNPNYCYVVGKDGGGVIRAWNGTSWSAPTTTADELKTVSCPSTTCYAAGEGGQPPLVFNGSTWVVDGTSNVSEEIKDIYCFSSTGCWGVGKRNGSNYTFAQRPGASFTWQETLVPGGANTKPDLEAVTCTSANNCWAAGKRSQPSDNFTLLQWNGSSWTSWPTAGLGRGEDLKDISCASANNCMAVGKKGSVLLWNGSTWSDASGGAINNTDLEAVTFMGGAAGSSVMVVRWQEVISN